jgi:hypothetical protein
MVAYLLVLVVTYREERIFVSISTVAMPFVMGALEQASLMAKFRLRAAQWA